ncbi:PAS domain S-box protein [Ideonella sp. A 288]|uniref:PAS domain S-box protein n=1 Tax=Ideonella sp. A 288 TaxID=1962181 RepID=UPI000B4A908C|nr:PAS domain S-box protein [Ideonella sp. A 288]
MSNPLQRPLLEIASRPVIHLGPDDTLVDVARLMAARRISFVPVLDADSRVLGLVTEGGLLSAMRGARCAPAALREVMVPALCVPASMPCHDAYRLCVERQVGQLVVVDEAGRALAVASETDFRVQINLAALAGRHRVPSVMKPVAHALSPQHTLQDALDLMASGPDAGLVVTDGQRPVGVLTARDTARLFAAGADAARLRLGEVMSAPVHSIGTTATINEAADRMLAERVRHLVVVDEQGRLVGMLSEHDLTRTLALGMMDDAMAQDRVRQRAVLDAIPDLVWLKDPLGVYLACNPRFERLYGAREADIRGRTDRDFVSTELAEFFRQHDVKAMAANGPSVNEEELTFADDGHRELTQTIKTPVRHPDGTLMGVLGIGRDITALRRVESEYRHLFARNPAPMLIYETGSLALVKANEAFQRLYGHAEAEVQTLNLTDLYLPEDRPALVERVATLHGLVAVGEARHVRKDGSVIHVMVQSHDLEHNGRACRLGVVTDVTQLERGRQRDRSRLALMEKLAHGEPLPELLTDLVLDHEALFPDSLCSILRVDDSGRHLRLGAAPSLPDFYNRAVDGLEIGPLVGSCGAAADTGRRVVAEDLSTHPNWQAFRDVAARAGLAACWSEPIIGAHGRVLGTFAVYRRRSARPTDEELDHVSFSVQLAATAITHGSTTRQLRDSERRLRDILRATPDLVWVKDTAGAFVACNAAFERLVGRLETEIVGRTGAGSADALAIAPVLGSDHQVMASRQPHVSERWLTFAEDGRRGLFEIIRTPLLDDAGQSVGVLGVARDITLIKQGARAIAEQERLIDTMFSQTTDAIVMVDPQTLSVVHFNDVACAGLGYGREAFARLKVSDFQAEFDLAAIRERAGRALAGEPARFETRHRCADGSERMVEVTLRRLGFAGRTLLSAVWHDITDRKRHEARIRRLNQSYAVLGDVSEAIVRLRDAGALFDEVCRIAVGRGGFRSASLVRLEAGTGAAEAIARAGQAAGPADPPGAVAAPNLASLAAGRPVVVDDAAVFPIPVAGQPVHALVLCSAEPGHFDDEQQALLARLAQDIGFALAFIDAEARLQRYRQHLEAQVADRTAELQAANTRLHREDQRLRAMLSLSQRASTLDEAALLQAGVDEIARLSGSPVACVHTVAEDGLTLQRQVWAHGASVAGPDGDELAALCQAAVARCDSVVTASGAPTPAVAAQVAERGRARLAVCVADGSGRYDEADRRELQLLAQDLWDILCRRRTEIALEQAKQTADAASQAKSAFLANMSHEIRTPMNAILGFSHLLRRDPLTPRQRDDLARITDASQHLLQVINDILDFSKIEARKTVLEVADFALRDSVERVVAMLADRLPRLPGASQATPVGDRAPMRPTEPAVALSMAIDPACPAWLCGDRLRLEQVLLNLLGNAVKFTHQGRIALRVAPLPGRGDAAAQTWLRFEVEDTGIGIGDDQMPHLFEAFEQADASTTRRFGGTGLGLAISRRLVDLMGGRIGAESTLGRGSRFWFELPFRPAQGDAVASTAVAASGPAAVDVSLQGAHVLLAEDHPLNRKVASDLLAMLGITVDVAEDGVAAVRQAAEGGHDLILMDVQMPHMDGLQATAAIRHLLGGAAVPIIALTANAFDADRAECLAAGMNDFLAKPVDPDELRRCLVRWMPARRPHPAPPAAAPNAPHPVAAPDDDAEAQAMELARVEAIGGLSVAAAMARMRAAWPRYRRMLQIFVGHHAADVQRLRDPVFVAEAQAVAQAAHSLAGAAAAVGADELQGLARVLQAVASTGGPEAPRAAAAVAVADELSRVRDGLLVALREGQPGPGGADHGLHKRVDADGASTR